MLTLNGTNLDPKLFIRSKAKTLRLITAWFTCTSLTGSISDMFLREYSLYEMWFFFLSKTFLPVTFWPHSDYINVFDGTGAQIFTRTGCQKNHTSNTFLEITFQESQNVTIQASLNNNQSYARVSYGILKNGLDSGENLWNTTELWATTTTMQQQQRHKCAYLAIKKRIFARFARLYIYSVCHQEYKMTCLTVVWTM